MMKGGGGCRLEGERIIGFLCGGFGCLRSRSIFRERKGGKMYDLKVGEINHALVKSIGITVAARRMVGKDSEVYEDLQNLEREVRGAAAECQRVLALIDADGKRPLISG